MFCIDSLRLLFDAIEQSIVGKPLTAKCVSAMKGARKMLMSDYELNPAIVKHCSTVISDKCGGMEKGGKTLHCLMKFGKRPNPDNFDMEKEAPECFKSVCLSLSFSTSAFLIVLRRPTSFREDLNAQLFFLIAAQRLLELLLAFSWFLLFRRRNFCYNHMTSQPLQNLLFVHSFMQFQLKCVCIVISRS